jgi:hypothetical protein
MNVPVDVSAGQAVADLLRSLGHDTAFVRDRDPCEERTPSVAGTCTARVSRSRHAGDLHLRTRTVLEGFLRIPVSKKSFHRPIAFGILVAWPTSPNCSKPPWSATAEP